MMGGSGSSRRGWGKLERVNEESREEEEQM